MLAKRIEQEIQGRCCHHHVVVLQLLVNLYPIHTYLELGVHNGTSMSYVVSQSRPIHCIGIDLFESTISRYSHDHLQQARTEKNIQALNTSSSKLTLIRGNTRHQSTLDQAISALDGRSIDLLFIDGDHEFAGAESDFLLYSPLVSIGGFIIFDDAHAQYPGIIACIKKHIESSLKYKVLGLFEGCDLIIQRVA